MSPPVACTLPQDFRYGFTRNEYRAHGVRGKRQPIRSPMCGPHRPKWACLRSPFDGHHRRRELDEVLGLMQRCIEKLAENADRVTCSAKLDFRRGAGGRLTAKVDSVEQKLGRPVRR